MKNNNFYLQDQHILFMALADGESKVRTDYLTLHTQSSIQVAEMMSGAKFKVVKVGGEVL